MKRRLTIVTLTTLAIYGCGGGGSSSNSGGNTVQGLQTPTSMNIISATETNGPSHVSGFDIDFSAAANFMAANYAGAGTDYTTDQVNSYVWDESMESLGMINEILCYMDQTGASSMVNQGAYTALVNEDKCQQGKNQSSAGDTGQSSGGQAEEFTLWTVRSTRASNTAPQYVSIWVPGDEGSADPMDAQTILVSMRIDEGVSASKPYGSFTMTFKGVADLSGFGGSTEGTTMVGTLRTVDNADGDVQFQFINVGGGDANAALSDFSFTEASNVIMDDADGTSGSALTSRSHADDGGSGQSTYALNFDDGHVLRGKDDNNDNIADAQACISRTDFDTQVWRYNLYHKVDGTFNNDSVTAGERVELNSGFPFTYNGNHGWMGYWGIWIDGDAAIPDGATITQVDYGSDDTTDYTVRVAPGKLIRRQANTENLSSLRGDEFMFWGEHGTLGFGEYIMTVDASNDFVITHSFSWGESGPETTDVVDDVVTPSSDGENLWLWSDALGGNIVYVHDTSVAANDRAVTFYSESFVSPDDATFSGGSPVNLYCYDRCLKGGLTQGDVDGASSEMDLYHTTTGNAYVYTAVVESGKLIVKDHLDATVSAAGLDLSGVNHEWGINTGEMATAVISGDWWEIYEQTTSYRWETGSNNWNQMITVVDGNGGYGSFDRPMSFSYTHATANDENGDSAYDTKKFLLQYGGVGELWGFPWVEDGNRWYSAVTLKDGTTLTDGTNDFVVKAVEKEQTMQTDPGACGALDIAGLFADPDLALPTASDIGTVDFTVSDKPTVTDAPAVVEGEVQGSEEA